MGGSQATSTASAPGCPPKAALGSSSRDAKARSRNCRQTSVRDNRNKIKYPHRLGWVEKLGSTVLVGRTQEVSGKWCVILGEGTPSVAGVTELGGMLLGSWTWARGGGRPDGSRAATEEV